MLRITLIAGLFLSLLLLARGIAATLQEEIGPDSPGGDKQATVAVGKSGFAFYPPVPVELPDLAQGYIFNEARLLTHEPPAMARGAEPGSGIADVSYVGSAISSERRVGIISHGAETRLNFRGASGTTRPGREPAASKYVHLAPGESFNGYLVTEVLPDRIVFEKEGIKTEKTLLERERATAPHARADRRTRERPVDGGARPERLGRPPQGLDIPGSVNNMGPAGKGIMVAELA